MVSLDHERVVLVSIYSTDRWVTVSFIENTVISGISYFIFIPWFSKCFIQGTRLKAGGKRNFKEFLRMKYVDGQIDGSDLRVIRSTFV